MPKQQKSQNNLVMRKCLNNLVLSTIWKNKMTNP